jgi:hypothetical protein
MITIRGTGYSRCYPSWVGPGRPPAKLVDSARHPSTIGEAAARVFGSCAAGTPRSTSRSLRART